MIHILVPDEHDTMAKPLQLHEIQLAVASATGQPNNQMISITKIRNQL